VGLGAGGCKGIDGWRCTKGCFYSSHQGQLSKIQSKVVAVTSRSLFNGMCVGSVEFVGRGLEK